MDRINNHQDHSKQKKEAVSKVINKRHCKEVRRSNLLIFNFNGLLRSARNDGNLAFVTTSFQD